MITLSANLRTILGKKTKHLKYNGRIPAVIYGPGVKNFSIDVEEREFKKVLKQAGESSLVEITIEGEKEKKPVLINEIQKDPVSGLIIHIDFYQADLKEEVQVAVPLVFEGVAPAEKDLGGTLNKNVLEIEVKAMPMNLPQQIKVDISSLKTFEDHILVKDLVIPTNVTVMKGADEIIAAVLAPVKVEEELAAEITEDVENVEKVVKEKKEDDVVPEVKE